MAADLKKSKVGYKKPPKEKQFSKGVSGNPCGRPPRTKNLSSQVLRVAARPVSITEPEGKRIGDYTEAMLLEMAQAAIKGDRHARRDFFDLLQIAERKEEARGSDQEPDELDLATIHGLVKRLQTIDTDSLLDPEISQPESDATEADAETNQTSDDADAEPPTPEEEQ